MSLDDVEERLRLFIISLLDLQEHLRGSVAELQHSHETLDRLWSDEARRTYDQRYASLLATVTHFSTKQLTDYIELLSERHKWLTAYLRGE